MPTFEVFGECDRINSDVNVWIVPFKILRNNAGMSDTLSEDELIRADSIVPSQAAQDYRRGRGLLPAAYAFSRYRFLGDKHLFFWLLSNRMAPPAVFVLPFIELYSAMKLFDTPLAVALAHCLFNVPLAVWILEGFMSGVPREVDETAYIDGYSFPHFFVKIFMPLIAAGIGVTAFFCFMFSWVEMLLAKNLTSVSAKPIVAVMTKTASTSGYELGLLAAAGALTLIPGVIVIWFVRKHIAKGFALGRV